MSVEPIKGFQRASEAKGLISAYAGCNFQEKLDGTRLQLYVTAEEHYAFTRRVSKESGYYMERTVETMHWRDDLKRIFKQAVEIGIVKPDGFVMLDGEAAHPNRELGFVPITTVQYPGELRYFMYDIIETSTGSYAHTAESDRESIMHRFVDPLNLKWIEVLQSFPDPSKWLYDFEWDMTIEHIAENCIKDEFEGFIIKPPNGIYSFDKGKNWLKVKRFEFEDVWAVGFKFGTGKYSNTCGKLIIQSFDGKRNSTVSGMTDEERHGFFTHFRQEEGVAPKELWFKIEIQFQQKTGRSWRHPRYKRVIHMGE